MIESYRQEMEDYFPSVGRIMLGAFFVFQGATKVTGGFSGFTSFVETLGFPAPTVVAGVIVAVEILGGLALLTGLRTRVVSVGLAAYLVLINLIVHQFWADPGQLPTFMKNLGLVGGLLAQSVLGSGRYSLESYLK